MAINSCVKRGTLWQLDDSISSLYRPRFCKYPRGESLVNQDTQRIAPDNGVVVVCLKPESSAHVVPPGGIITNVSGSLVIFDVVRICVCKSSFLMLTNWQKEQQNKQKRSSFLASFSDFGSHCIGQNKNSLLK